MAFAAQFNNKNPNDPNNQNNNISGSTSFATNLPGQNAGSGAVASQKSSKSSGQYQNLESYLDANKEQASNMSNQIGNKVSSDANTAMSNKASYDSGTPGQVKSYTKDDVYSIYSNPKSMNSTDYANLKNTGGYSGPQDYTKVSGYDPFSKSVKTASDELTNLGSEGGRQTLLANQFARPSYSGGQQKLDQTLLQNNASTKGDFANIQSKYGDLNKLFTDSTTKAQDAINNNLKTSMANKSLIPQAETEYINNTFINPLQARADQANIENPKKIQDYKTAIANKTLSAEQLATLGLSAGTRKYGLDLNSYLTPDFTQVGINNVATADERQKYSDLLNLIGSNDQRITMNGKSINPLKFNNEQFSKDLSGKANEFENWARSQNINTSAVVDPSYEGTENETTYQANANANLWNYLHNPNAINITGGTINNNQAFMLNPNNPDVINQINANARQQAYQQLQNLINNSSWNDVI